MAYTEKQDRDSHGWILYVLGIAQCLTFGLGAINFSGNTKKAVAASSVLFPLKMCLQ